MPRHTLGGVIHTLGPDWLNAQHLLTTLGPQAFAVSLAVIFAECGLFTFFMPGDSLLFTIGLAIQTPSLIDLHVNIVAACAMLSVAAFLGNVVGYEIGRAVGPTLYTRGGRLLKPEHFDKAHQFFEKHGNKAIVLARFVPIVRTFITAVAGVSKMDRRRFFTYSFIGALLWATGVTLLWLRWRRYSTPTGISEITTIRMSMTSMCLPTKSICPRKYPRRVTPVAHRSAPMKL